MPKNMQYIEGFIIKWHGEASQKYQTKQRSGLKNRSERALTELDGSCRGDGEHWGFELQVRSSYRGSDLNSESIRYVVNIEPTLTISLFLLIQHQQ